MYHADSAPGRRPGGAIPSQPAPRGLGLILLVPGSVGLRSVNALVAQDTLAGIQTAFTVGMVAISLVTGLLVANVLLPSRRAV